MWNQCGKWALAGVLSAAGCAGPRAAEVSRIWEVSEAQPGDVVADVGSGKGELTVELAQRVGEDGRVLATEVDAGRRDATARRAREQGLQNVVVVEATTTDTGLAPECCDAIVIRHAYHHFTDPAPTLERLAAALRPGGRLVVVDFAPSRLLARSTPEGIPADRGGHGISPAIVVREAEGAGLRHADTHTSWPGPWPLDNFCAVFDKPDNG